MKRRKYGVAIVTLAVCLLTINAFPAYGQGRRGATRIRFKRGESSVIVNGQLSNKRLNQYFLVGAKAGQEMYVQVKGRNDSASLPFNFVVNPPSGKSGTANWDGNAVRIRLKETGDYEIKVELPRYLEGSVQYFSVFVKIE